MRVRKSGCVESNWTRCCTGKFNTALSLCRVLGITFYFSEGFSEAAAGVSAVAKHCSLWERLWSAFRIGVQLVVSCTAIEAQIVFKMLLALITS